MALPHDLYIRYLITKGCDGLKSVNDALREIRLPEITQEDFGRNYDFVEKNVPPNVLKQASKQRYEQKFIKWMDHLSIGDIWKREGMWKHKAHAAAWELIMGCFSDRLLILTINSLLVKMPSDVEVAEIITARFSAMLQGPHVALYRKYFFNCSRMTRKDWNIYLRSCGPDEQHLYFTALSESLDVLKTELELPANVSVASSLQFLFMKSFQKAKSYLKNSTPESNREARAWIGQTMSLADKYEKYKTGDKADFSKQLIMEFDYVDEEIPGPDDDMIALMAGHKEVGDK